MKVAITFIGTNKYLDFLPKYYENIEKYFLPNSEKTIFAFTDGELNDTPDNLKVYHQEHLEWPFITLKRFEIINKAREEIDKHDWLVFIDADALQIMEGALKVSDLQAREIMIPKSQMTLIESDFSLEKVLSVVTQSQHSRFPVIGESSDDVLGILLAKELIPLILL